MKKIEKMVMTEKLANKLMDTLACVAISATGGIVKDANGNFNQEQIDFAQEYAKQAFCNILGAWEEQTGKEWSIALSKARNNLT